MTPTPTTTTTQQGRRTIAVAIYSWYDLAWKEQRTVLRLARQGRRHPDSKMVRVAEEWAMEKLGKYHGKAGALARASSAVCSRMGPHWAKGCATTDGPSGHASRRAAMTARRRPLPTAPSGPLKGARRP
jgi:hypothetical protein